VRRGPDAFSPIRWSEEDLERDRQLAIAEFREERLTEPLDEYLAAFDQVQSAIEEVLEQTVDLEALDQYGLDLLTGNRSQEVFRYLTGPPISQDDLRTVVGASSMSPKALRANPDLVRQLVATVRDILDQRRFPWVREGRDPTEAERTAAIVATASLIASQRVQTHRRNQGKSAQEQRVRLELLAAGLAPLKAPGRARIDAPKDWPQPGGFYAGEVTLYGRKADQLVGLWDGHLMPIECKVSNSSINSVKRLNNDAAAKAAGWIMDIGRRQVVPVAVLSGVYECHHLVDAQDRGLMLVWAHRLSDLVAWIEATRAIT
jgi:hypothetical protein